MTNDTLAARRELLVEIADIEYDLRTLEAIAGPSAASENARARLAVLRTNTLRQLQVLLDAAGTIH